MKKFLLSVVSLFLFAILVAALLPTPCPAADSGFRVKDLRSTENGADYIAITSKQFYKELLPLLEYRADNGLTPAVVVPQQIYAAFDRLPEGPRAIKAFINYAYNNWDPAPKFILLAGDINVYEDYDPDSVSIPTFVSPVWGDAITPTDAPFGDIDDDVIPEIAVGRLPADTPGELAAMVKKIINYETNPEPGPWRRRVSAFASTGDFGIFDSTLEELTKRITANNFDPLFDMNMTYGGSKLPYFMLPDEFSDKVFSRFDDGALLMSYIGHGHVTGLSSVCWNKKCERILEVDDVHRIKAGGKNPFFISICCLTGKFNIYTDAIAEEMLKHPEGPVGVVAAGEVSHPYANAIFSKDMMFYLVTRRPETFGRGVMDMQAALVERFDPDRMFMDQQFKLLMDKDEMLDLSYDHILMYNYFGDPATKIQYPLDNLEVSAPASGKPGDTLDITIKNPAPGTAKLLVTLEAHTTVVIYPIKNIELLEGQELREAVRSNYANANNKIAASVESTLDADGSAKLQIIVPDFVQPGKYFVKAYSWDGTPDATGMAMLELENDNPPDVFEEEPEKEDKEELTDHLARYLETAQAPDTPDWKNTSLPDNEEIYFRKFKLDAVKEIVNNHTRPDWPEFIPRLAQLLMRENSANLETAFDLAWQYTILKGFKNPKAAAVAEMIHVLDLSGASSSADYMDMALELDPDCLECLTIDYKNMGALNAKNYCAKAIDIDPSYITGYQCLAEKHFNGDDFEMAAEYFSQLRQVASPPLSADEIISLAKAGKKDSVRDENRASAFQLIESAKEFEESYADDHDTQMAAGKIMMYAEIEKAELDRFKEDEKKSNKDHKKDRDKNKHFSPPQPREPGKAWLKAQALFDQFVSKHGGNSAIRHIMALAAAMRDDLQLAAALEKKAVELDPACSACFAALGNFSAQLLQWSDSAAALEKAVALDPGSADLKADLARALIKLGRRDEARTLLIEAHEMEPRNDFVEKTFTWLIPKDVFY